MRENDGLAGILRKSSRLIARKGFHGCSMRDLAQETDRSLAGLYHYFRSKEELLYLINRDGFSSLLQAAKEVEGARLSADEKLYALIFSHVRHFNAHRDEMRVMMFGTQELDSRQGREIRDLKRGYAAVGQRIVAAYLAEELGRRPPRKELSRKTYLLFGMMNWIFGWYSPRKHGSCVQLVDDIHATFTRGARPAAPQPGREA